MACQATDEDHCCWVAGHICDLYDPTVPLGGRCSLRAAYDDWEAVYSDARYPFDVAQIRCGDYPTRSVCGDCGAVPVEVT